MPADRGISTCCATGTEAACAADIRSVRNRAVSRRHIGRSFAAALSCENSSKTSQLGGFDGRTRHPIYGRSNSSNHALQGFPRRGLPRRLPSVLNKFGPSGHGEAQVQYLDGDFRVISPGTFVRCAISDTRIPLDELKYWSVDLQEAYATPAAILQRHFPGAPKPQA